MPAFIAVEPLPDPAGQRGARKLALFGKIGIGIFTCWFWLNSPWRDGMLNLVIIAMFAAGVWPVLAWLERGDASYPLVEVIQLTMVPFYVLPLVYEHEGVAAYPESLLIRAALTVLLFQLACAMGSFAASRLHSPGRGVRWWHELILPEEKLGITAHTVTIFTLWLVVSTFYAEWIPEGWLGTFRAVFFGIGIISVFIQARFWGSGHLSRGGKILLVVNVGLQILLIFLSLMLITGIIQFLVVLLGYFSSARRLPWLVCACVLPPFAILHNGKAQMREVYWTEHSVAPKVGDLPSFFSQWFEFGLGLASEDPAQAKRKNSGSYRLLERASLFHIVCYTVDTVPERTSFLAGRTYSLIPAQIFPRFLWPGKPSPNDSVKILSMKLGLLTEDETEHTSIGYGLLAEAYANFGLFGPVIIGCALGFVLRWVAVSTIRCATFSIAGVFRILCLAWCINTESTMAVWLSSLYQACIAIFVPLLLWRSMTR